MSKDDPLGWVLKLLLCSPNKDVQQSILPELRYDRVVSNGISEAVRLPETPPRRYNLLCDCVIM